MKIILEILGFIVGIIIICVLIEHFLGVHIGLAELFQKFMSEMKALFALTQTSA